VASLGGELSVRSQRGAGTCWRAVLPLVSEERAPAVVVPERGAGNPRDQLSPLGT
jgi:hypothetical protein